MTLIKTIRPLFYLVIGIIVLHSCKQASGVPDQASLTSEEELELKIDAYFTALTQLDKFNGVILVTKDDQPVIHKAYNLHPEPNSTTFVSPDHQFDIHSVSKLMALYIIEKFELEGKLSKQQTVDHFYSGFPQGNKITLNMLLDHTSGLPRELEAVEGEAIDLSPDQIIELAGRQQLLFEPGTDSQYSNVAYELVYAIIEKVSQRSFSQTLNHEVFEPLEMLQSGAHFYMDENRINKLAKNHIRKDSEIVRVDNIQNEELRTARIFSTARDLNKFLNHIKMEPYASLLKDDSDVIEKNGGSDGIRAQIYTNLKYDYNFILLSNYEEIPFQKTIEDFIKILEDQPYEIPREINRKAIAIDESILKNYVGIYVFEDLGGAELRIEAKDGTLLVYQNGDLAGKLLSESEHVFFEDPKSPESFEFIENDNGGFDVLMGFKGVKLKGAKE